jgi:uncharacterized protein YacL
MPETEPIGEGASPEPGAQTPPPVQRVSGYAPPSVQAAEERYSQALLVRVLRAIFLIVLITVTVSTFASAARQPEDFEFTKMLGIVMAALSIGLVAVLIDAMMPHKRLSTIVAVYVGVCAALLVSLALGALINVVVEAWALSGRMLIYADLVKVIIAIVLCYLTISVVLTTKDDFRLVIPYVEFAKQVRGVRPLLLDTSVIIDGRIESFGSTGFVDAPLVVPQFVIDELQALADSGDKMKRAKGRRGLTVLTRLQTDPYLDVSIDHPDIAGHSVDHMLLTMAKDQNLRVLTTDYNLNKVAQIQGVSVLNINDLANSLKAQAIPGETMAIEIVKQGEGPHQGVGYLPDGTMVVVEQAGRRIGETVQLVVTNSLQTSAGRMIFGRLTEDGEQDREAHRDTQLVEQMARAATHQVRAVQKPGRVDRAEPRRNPRR